MTGRIVTGIVKSESATAVTLLDREGKSITVPLGAIEHREVSKVSLMPEGLADRMTPAEFTDLIAYLVTLRTRRDLHERAKEVLARNEEVASIQ